MGVAFILLNKGITQMNKSVSKALQLLELFIEEEQLSLHEVSTRANMPKSTAYRLLETMESHQFLHKTKETKHDSQYELGLKLLEYGQLVAERFELRGIALPFMRKLQKKINEAVHLVVINKGMATYIEKVDSSRALRLNTRIGKSSPLHIGSGPKLLFAFLPKNKQIQMLQEPLYIHEKMIDQIEFKQELREIKRQGYAYSIGEQDANTTGISYPVYNHEGKVIAALTVSGLSTYYEGENLLKIKQEAEKTAQAISSQLGYT